MSERNNRRAGHQWERDVVKILRDCGYPDASTTRACNRARDGEGIDVCNADELKNGRMRDDIQLKDTTGIDWKLLVELEKRDKSRNKRRKVLIVKLGKTSKIAHRRHLGKFALMFDRDYYELLKIYNAAKVLIRCQSRTSEEFVNAVELLKNHFNDSAN